MAISIRNLWARLTRDHESRGRRNQRGRGRPATPLALTGWAWTTSPRFDLDLANYIQNVWVSTAADRMAELCASTSLRLVERATLQSVDEHPLLMLLGEGGQPNPFQSIQEFWEAHFQRVDIFGNDVWYLHSESGGAPDWIFQLEPGNIALVQDRGGLKYQYHSPTGSLSIPTESVLHFRRPDISQQAVHWGASALSKLRALVKTEALMTDWNDQFFASGAPDGILVVDADYVSQADADTIEDEFVSRAHDNRRMVVIRARAGAGVWQDANLRPRDVDFSAGRGLTRQAVFDAFGFHVGLVSESSTEAHARVAERLVRNTAYFRHRRTLSVLSRILAYWPGAAKYQLRFEDVRVVDWEQESKKLAAVMPYVTINEVRTKYLDLPSIVSGDRFAGQFEENDHGKLEDGAGILGLSTESGEEN